MIKTSQKFQIYDLLQAGRTVADVASRLGISKVTIYKYKKIHETQSQLTIQDKPTNLTIAAPKKLLPFLGRINLYLSDGINNCRKIFLDLMKDGYAGSYATLNSYIRSKDLSLNNYKRCVSIETIPGEQAQVDWAYFGEICLKDRKAKLYAFTYLLSYSRAFYAEFVIRQNQQTFQQCHINAFNILGIPQIILYDNIKTVILSREKLAQGKKIIHYNPSFLDFSRYYGFLPDVCPPYWPRSKGKIEAGVKYLKNNFIPGILNKRNSLLLDELNNKLNEWIENVAQQRIHAATGEKPIERWKNEKASLRFPDVPPYDTSPLITRRSTKDGLIQYKSNFYSVPSELSAKNLDIREVNKQGVCSIKIYHNDILIVTHLKALDRGKWVVDDKHLFGKSLSDTKDKSQKVSSKKSGNQLRVVVATRKLSYYDKLFLSK